MKLITESIKITLSRIMLLSMPLVDLAFIGHLSPASTANFVLSTQFMQIGVIALVSLTIGINAILHKIGVNKSYSVMYFAVVNSLLINLILLIVSYFSFGNDVHLLNIILATSMPFCAIAISVSAIIETIGNSSYSAWISTLAAICNVVVNTLFIHLFDFNTGISISLSTGLIRVLQSFSLLLILYRVLGFHINWQLDLGTFKTLYSYTSIEKACSIMTYIIFSLILTLCSVYFNDSSLKYLGLSLNFINVISILSASYCIAFTISYSKCSKNQLISGFCSNIKRKLYYIAPIFVSLYICREFIMRAYTPDVSTLWSELITLSILFGFFDGILNFTTSNYRLLGLKRLAPIIKLIAISTGFIVGFSISVSLDDISWILRSAVLSLCISSMACILIMMRYHLFSRYTRSSLAHLTGHLHNLLVFIFRCTHRFIERMLPSKHHDYHYDAILRQFVKEGFGPQHIKTYLSHKMNKEDLEEKLNQIDWSTTCSQELNRKFGLETSFTRELKGRAMRHLLFKGFSIGIIMDTLDRL